MKSEKDLQSYLRQVAYRAGVLFHKVESRSTRGFPDVMLMHGGVVVFVELKTPSGEGRLSAAQKVCIRDIQAHGGTVRVIDSVAGVDEIVPEIINMSGG